jgi:hypothetical protein
MSKIALNTPCAVSDKAHAWLIGAHLHAIRVCGPKWYLDRDKSPEANLFWFILAMQPSRQLALPAPESNA